MLSVLYVRKRADFRSQVAFAAVSLLQVLQLQTQKAVLSPHTWKIDCFASELPPVFAAAK